MAWNFGDSFDLYATASDLTAGYWDSIAGALPALGAGRFAGSRCIPFNNPGQSFTKSSGVNDTVHHVVCAFQQSTAISGSILSNYFQLMDGLTAQCSIVFRSDGAIVLTSGGPTGTVLATYTGAFTAANVWYGFEFEVVINATTGSFAARVNGSPTNNFSATGLNTRAAASAAIVTPNNSSSIGANIAYAVPFAAPSAAPVTGGTISVNTAATGHIKIALYDNGLNLVANGTANVITNPTVGLNTFTFPTPPTLVPNATYYLAYDFDVAITCNVLFSVNNMLSINPLSYASFPPSSFSAGVIGNLQPPGLTLNLNNSFANKLTFGMNATAAGTQSIDDLFWRSDASSVAWMGDIRCYPRMPANDTQSQFSRVPAIVSQPTASSFTSVSIANATAYYAPFTANAGGTVGTITFTMAVGFTGNLKCSLFNDNAGSPGTVLASATPLANPSSSTTNTLTFPTPPTLVKGTPYWVGFTPDTTAGQIFIASGTTGRSGATTYASFPVANPASLSPSAALIATLVITATTNSQAVSEAQQDGLTSYAFDSNPGDADFYSIAGIGSTPAAVIACTTRGFIQKSDAGARTAAVQLKSGATTVASPTLTLSTNFTWAWRTDAVDPNTGAAWTPANVNNVQIGPTVIA